MSALSSTDRGRIFHRPHGQRRETDRKTSLHSSVLFLTPKRPASGWALPRAVTADFVLKLRGRHPCIIIPFSVVFLYMLKAEPHIILQLAVTRGFIERRSRTTGGIAHTRCSSPVALQTSKGIKGGWRTWSLPLLAFSCTCPHYRRSAGLSASWHPKFVTARIDAKAAIGHF